jgi:hypothetical protein
MAQKFNVVRVLRNKKAVRSVYLFNMLFNLAVFGNKTNLELLLIIEFITEILTEAVSLEKFRYIYLNQDV